MSIWQTKKWGEMLIKSNQSDKIFEIDGIFIEKRKVSFGEYGLFILGLEKELKSEQINSIIELCKKEKCLFVQIEDLNYNGIEFKNIKNFTNGYYKKFITPYTAIIDLNKSEDEILASMKPKGRYNIKVARKNDVVVNEVEKTEENIKKYYDLMLETTSRDGFSGNNFDFYKIFLTSLDNSKLLLASKNEKVIAGGIFTFDKDISIYYYGASTSSREYRNLMAPYLLQWKAIEIAKNYGSKMYDFLGIASQEDKNSSLSGVTDFKLKLTKDSRKVSESYIYINKKFKYLFIQFLRKLRNK